MNRMERVYCFVWFISLLTMTMFENGSFVAAYVSKIRILGILWLTSGNDILQNEEIYSSYPGMIIAMKHFNERSSVLPELEELKGNCNVTLSFVDHIMYDSAGQPNLAMSLFIRKYARQGVDAVYVVRSEIAQAIGVTAGALNIPIMSHAATADTLSNKQIYPTFYRTVTSDSYKASLFATILHVMKYRAVGLLYLDDAFGRAFQASLQAAVAAYDIKFVDGAFSAARDDELQTEISRALDVLIRERIQIIIFAGVDDKMLYALAQAADERNWIHGRLYFHNRIPSMDSYAKAPNKPLMLRFLHGSLGIRPGSSMKNPVYQRVSKLMHTWNVTEINEFFPEGTSSSGKPYRYASDYFIKLAQQSNPPRSWTYAYDSVMAIGLAACQKSAFYQGLAQVRFNGTSGPVLFDDQNNRQGEMFILENIKTTNGVIHAETVGFAHGHNWSLSLDLIEFSDGTNTIPLDVEPPTHYIDSLPRGAVIWGGIAMTILTGFSIVALLLLVCYRKDEAFVESQPVFMFLLGLGCIFIGLSLLGLIVENDFGCMLFPWSCSIGFALSLSSIIGKSVRVAILWYGGGPIQSRNQSAAIPRLLAVVAVAVVGLVAILMSWQLIAPLKFSVQTTKRDSFNYPLYSSAMCLADHPISTVFLCLVITYVCVLVFAAMSVSFWVRNVPERFQEARTTAFACISMFQIFFAGLPTAIAVWDMALPRFLVLSSITFVLGMIMLLSSFLTKLQRIQFNQEYSSEIRQSNNHEDNDEHQGITGRRSANKIRVDKVRGRMRKQGERELKSIAERVVETFQEVHGSLPTVHHAKDNIGQEQEEMEVSKSDIDSHGPSVAQFNDVPNAEASFRKSVKNESPEMITLS